MIFFLSFFSLGGCVCVGLGFGLDCAGFEKLVSLCICYC